MTIAMKNKKQHLAAYIILTAVTLIISISFIFFLPDRIPVHYGPDGNVDRFGSKFELFLLPCVSIVMAAILWFSAGFTSRKETSTKNNEKIVLITGECVLAMFLIMQIYFSCLALNNVENIYSFHIDIGKLLSILYGIFMIVVGNIMPKAKKNSFIGFRCSWTMKDEETWRKSQRFSGIASIITGAAMLICAALFSEMTAFIALLILVFLMLIVCLIYAYRISHNAK